MNKFPRLFKRLWVQLLIVLLNYYSVSSVFGVQKNQAINPDKPDEAFFRIIFNPLADQVGKTWAIQNVT